MANTILPGFTPPDYLLASQLGYTNETANALGSEGLRAALNNKTKFQPAVKAPTAISPVEREYGVGSEIVKAPVQKQTNVVPPQDMNQNTNIPPDTSSFYNQIENESPFYDPFSIGDYGSKDVLKDGYKIVDGKPVEMNQLERTQQAQEGMYNSMANDMGTSWNDWANIGLGGLGTGMQLGLYGDRKDYLSSSADALEQATQNSEEAHNKKMTNNASYGSAFSQA